MLKDSNVLEFEEASHTYRWNGAVKPSVTGIIAPLVGDFLRFCTPEQLEHARREGVAIHKTVELDCAGTLDEEQLPAWLRPYLSAWRKFVSETGFELGASETWVYNKHFGYAGTLDLAGLLTKVKRGPWAAIIDIKRTLSGQPAVGVQLSGYLDAWNRECEKGRRANCRFGLQLRANGEYRLEPFEDPEDFNAFLSCLTLQRWREKNEHRK